MKKFFSDFLDLPKHEFFRKYFLLPVTVFMLCVSIWLGAIIFTPLERLRRTEGTVSGIDSVVTKVKNKPLFKEVTQELRISLSRQPNYFTISSTSGFSDITSTIKQGDHVVIYSNVPFHKWFFGESPRIYQLEKNAQVIIDFDTYQKTLTLPLVLLIIFTFGFGVYYFYWRSKSN